jgi:hypothetical protein
MPNGFAVRAENLVKVYEGTVRALDGVTLSVEEGSSGRSWARMGQVRRPL